LLLLLLRLRLLLLLLLLLVLLMWVAGICDDSVLLHSRIAVRTLQHSGMGVIKSALGLVGCACSSTVLP
jgi:hypothetical protein